MAGCQRSREVFNYIVFSRPLIGKLNLRGYLISRLYISYSRNSRKFDAREKVFFSNKTAISKLHLLPFQAVEWLDLVHSKHLKTTQVMRQITIMEQIILERIINRGVATGGISLYIPPKSGQVNFLWSNNDVRMVIELIPFPIWKFQTDYR